MRHPNLCRQVQYLAEEHAMWMLENLGYRVYVHGHNDQCDLNVNGRLCVKVKGAMWWSTPTRVGRYQFNTRQRPNVYILRCLSIPGADFVIPGREIGDRKNIAIWSRDPTKYGGQWATYLNAWHVIEAELERTRDDENPD